MPSSILHVPLLYANGAGETLKPFLCSQHLSHISSPLLPFTFLKLEMCVCRVAALFTCSKSAGGGACKAKGRSRRPNPGRILPLAGCHVASFGIANYGETDKAVFMTGCKASNSTCSLVVEVRAEKQGCIQIPYVHARVDTSGQTLAHSSLRNLHA